MPSYPWQSEDENINLILGENQELTCHKSQIWELYCKILNLAGNMLPTWEWGPELNGLYGADTQVYKVYIEWDLWPCYL